MALQLARVVVPRDVEIIEPRDHPIVHDLNDIGLFLILRHAIDDGAIFRQGRLPIFFAIALHHFGKIKVDFVTRPVLDQTQPVSILDLTANRWNPHRGLGTAADPRRPVSPACHLHPPEAEPERAATEKHKQAQELDP